MKAKRLKLHKRLSIVTYAQERRSTSSLQMHIFKIFTYFILNKKKVNLYFSYCFFDSLLTRANYLLPEAILLHTRVNLGNNS